MNYSIPQHIPVITIDGPTASGKGTIAQAVSKILGFHLLDSGALYRLVALHAKQNNIPYDNENAISKLAEKLPCRFANGRILLDSIDVTDTIREEEIGLGASRVATLPAVRNALEARQHRFRQPPGLIADGRDMGTVIFPDADLKIYLTASVQARALRRYKQLKDKGITAIMRDLERDLAERDARDMNRATAPLKPAKDAKILDTSELTIEETIRKVLDWYKEVA